MIHLIRIYRDDQIHPVYVEAVEHGESREGPPDFPGGHPRGCRCRPTWSDYYNWLAKEHNGRVDYDTIYPTPRKAQP